MRHRPGKCPLGSRTRPFEQLLPSRSSSFNRRDRQHQLEALAIIENESIASD